MFKLSWASNWVIIENWDLWKIAHLINSRIIKYDDTESIRGLETIAIQNYIFQYIYNKSVQGNFSSDECINQSNQWFANNKNVKNN